MNPTVFVVPKRDARVVDPDTGQALPAGGAPVTWSVHWERRRREGDVQVRDAHKKAAKESVK